MKDYVAEYPGSFKAPCKLVFTHPKTESHHAGTYSIDVPEDLVNAILAQILDGECGLNEEGKQMYRSIFIADMRFPIFLDKDGNEEPYKMFLRRETSDARSGEDDQGIAHGDDHGQ